jgi:hypothetical protein
VDFWQSSARSGLEPRAGWLELDGRAPTLSSTTHLPARPRDLVDYVGKDNVLIVSVATHLLPLWVLPQPHIITKEGVADAGGLALLVVLVGLDMW